MALILANKRVEVPALHLSRTLDSVDFQLDSKFELHDRGKRRRRTRWIRGIVFHTRMGIWPQRIIDRGRDRHWDEYLAGRWERSGKAVGAHIAVDGDGSYACLADIIDDATYHAGQVNEYTVGIELYQEADGRVYMPTLESGLAIADVLTRELGIQRQYCIDRVIHERFARPLPRTKAGRQAFMPGGREGRDFVGLYGHRNVTRNRGQGDPGDEIWKLLGEAGYEPIDLGGDPEKDRDIWCDRQAGLGFDEDDIDGIPGPMTVKALCKSGYPWGLWVSRPGD